MRRRRALRWTITAVAAILIAAVAGIVVAYPVVGAAACPGCFGLRKAGPGVYVDSSATADQRRQMVDMVAAARQRVRDFYGEISSHPRVLICLSSGCYGRIGGGEKGQTWRDVTVALSPDGATVVIAVHELVHAEQHRRLGSHYDRVPRWFQEGLAVVVSEDPRYLTTRPAGERCPIDYAEALSVTRAEPPPGAGQDLYRDGACVVDRWLATHGGPDAVHDLNRRLLAGEPFTDIVPALEEHRNGN